MATKSVRAPGAWHRAICRARRARGSSPGHPSKRHSTYRSQLARIAYPRHPLHGEQFRVVQRSKRGGEKILYLEARAGTSREIPGWMCDAGACAALSVGKPQIGVEALNELRVVLTAYVADSKVRETMASSDREEGFHNEPNPDTTDAGPGGRTKIPSGRTPAGGAAPGPGRAVAWRAEHADISRKGGVR
jgi:hypothetical protein